MSRKMLSLNNVPFDDYWIQYKNGYDKHSINDLVFETLNGVSTVQKMLQIYQNFYKLAYSPRKHQQ
jgi:hypothetical protein